MKIRSVKPDGRSARWAGHRQERRAELVAHALEAARRFGADCGLAEIAAAAGVTKPVLYRHFDDKDDLVRAVLAAIAGEVFLPAMAEALAPGLGAPPDDLPDDPPDDALVRTAVATYVDLLQRDRALYEFARAHSAVADAGEGDFVAGMEDALAQALVALGAARDGGTVLSAGGARAVTAAYGVVGAVQLAVHRWLREQDLEPEELVEVLTRLVWSGLAPTGCD